MRARITRIRRMSIALAGLAFVAAGCSAITGAGSTGVVSESAVAPTPAAPAAVASAAAGSGGGRYGNGDYGNGDYGGAASPAASTASSGAAVVKVASGPIGRFLTGTDGKTLYTFKKDSPNASACSGDCAASWPPFTVSADGTVTAGDGVTGKLTTFARADGTMQVAYDGAPLYYFAADHAAGDTNGQGVQNVWFVAAP